MGMTISRLVYMIDTEAEKPYSLDAYKSKNGKVVVDESLEFKEYKAFEKRLRELLAKVKEEV